MTSQSLPKAINTDRWIGSRGRIILKTSAWSTIAKSAAAANLFLTVPFVLHALGSVKFGVWATLVSLVTIAGFLDFGIGNGTMNLVAAAHSRGNNQVVSSILREGLRTLIGVGFCLAVVTVIVLPLVSWQRLLGLSDTMSSNVRGAVAVVLFSIVLAVPLNLANRVQLGIGRGDRAFRWQAVGQMLAAATVILLAKLNASLIALVAAAVSTPLITSFINSWLMWHDPFFVCSSATIRQPKIASYIRREGALFFVLQLAAALAFSADLPLISALRSPVDAGNYAIAQRLFLIVPMTLSLLWLPLWPIYRQALARGDRHWIVQTLRRSILAAAAYSCCMGAALYFGSAFVMGMWIHLPLHLSKVLLAGFSIWYVIDAVGTAIATFLNAASVMRYQVIVASVFATICLASKVVVLDRFGIEALPWATITTYLTASLLPTLLMSRRLFARALAKEY